MQSSSLASAVTRTGIGPDVIFAADTQSAGVSGGYSVAIPTAIASFFTSLSPRYIPENSQTLPPAPVVNGGEVPGKNSWSVRSSDVAGKIKLACNLASSWIPQLQAAGETVAALCSSLTLANDLGSVLEQKKDKKHAIACHPAPSGTACAGAVTFIVLDNLACAAAVPTPGERGSPQQPIDVPDSATLAKIGRNNSFPADACYRQTSSFSHNHPEPGVIFQGHYEGGCYTISNLNSCLFSKLDRYATVRDLRLADASIEREAPQLAALACEMDSYSSIQNIEADNISVHTWALGNSFMPATVGVITGYQRRAAEVSDIDLRHCHVIASEGHSAAGIIAGLASGELRNINITDSYVHSTSFNSPTGVGVGELRGNINNLLVRKGSAMTFYRRSPTGIGAGLVRGGGQVSRLAAVRSSSLAMGGDSSSGIGAGKIEGGGQLRGLTVLSCRSKTDHTDAPAGIGVGSLNGELTGMVSVKSKAITLSPGSNAAIGAGNNMGQIDDLTTVNCSVRAKHGRTGLASARGEGSDRGTISLNTRIGEKIQPNKGVADLPRLCAKGDARLLTADCQTVQPPENISLWSCPSNNLQATNDSRWQPIEVSDMATLNSIGLCNRFPADAHYIQSADLNGALLDRNIALNFSGYYDGQHHTIDGLRTCLFDVVSGTVRNLQLTNARIVAEGRQIGIGVLSCQMSGASGVEKILINNSRVVTRGALADAGLISGRQQGAFNQAKGIEINNSTLETYGALANAGMVAGECQGDIEQVNVHRSQVKTHGCGSVSGLGCGLIGGQFRHFTATCDRVETYGNDTIAGGFTGRNLGGRFGPATLVRSTMTSAGARADNGLGTGAVTVGLLEDITIMECRLHALGKEARIGIGAGRVDDEGSLHNINTISCDLIAEGDQVSAGICAGVSESLNQISGCITLNNTLYTLGKNSRTSPVVVTGSDCLKVGDLVGATVIDTQINGRPYYIASGNRTVDTAFCQTVDPRFIQPDCQGGATPTCPLPPLTITAVSTTVPAVAATSISVGVMVGLVAGSALVIGAGILGAYCFSRYRQARETPLQDNGSDYSQSFIEDEDRIMLGKLD